MPYSELTTKEIENWMEIKREGVPKHLILYATWPWPHVKKIKEVRRYLKNPKLAAPNALGNYWIGELDGKKVGFMLVYGHGMTADMIFIMAKLGVKYIYQIGTMGALQKSINLFDLIVPEKVIKFEGLPYFFCKQKFVECDKKLLEITKDILEEKKFRNYYIGKTISIDFLFAETKKLVRELSKKRFLAADMETATNYAVSKMLGIKSIAILMIIDNAAKEELLSDLKYKIRKREIQRNRKFVKEIVSEIIKRIDECGGS